MRFVHASDLHIDSPLRGLDRYEGAPVARLRTATRAALGRLVDMAIAGGGQVMIFTHHRHLVDLARAALGDQALAVHSL